MPCQNYLILLTQGKLRPEKRFDYNNYIFTWQSYLEPGYTRLQEEPAIYILLKYVTSNFLTQPLDQGEEEPLRAWSVSFLEL